MFKTPENICNMSENEILELVQDKVPNMRGNRQGRLKIIKLIYTVLGFDLPPELLLIQLSETPALAVIATAGAGKTTFVQAKILLEKLLRVQSKTKEPIKGEKILCLVYNTHNVKQLKDKQQQFVARLKSCGAQGINIDNDVNAMTMHSFCQTWIMQYTARCKLLNNRLISDSESNTMLAGCVKALERRKGKDYSNDTLSNILKLYNVAKESLVNYNDMNSLEAFAGMNTKKEDLVELFEAYDNTKSFRSVYDFSDMLIKLYELLKFDEEVRTYIQNYYHYITADEVQDFTPVMMEILRMIKGENVPLICIGDEDQSIYSFRGADIYNTLDFENKFDGGEIYSLGINRRCGKNILDAAKSIIMSNTLRFNKSIGSIVPGGELEYVPYSTQDGQLINLCNRIKKLPVSELEETIICYRNKKSSMILSDMLERLKIPFNVISGYQPFDHELFRHVFDVLNILFRPYDREYVINLYKVLPIGKNELFELLGYDGKKRKWKSENELKHFAEYDYGKYNKSASFVKEMQNLLLIAKGVQEFPLDTYFDKLFIRIKKYFWNYKMELNNEEDMDNYYTAEVYRFFNVNLTFALLESDYMKRKRLCKLNNLSKSGVSLSTFHGLKGLEFNNVFIIDLEDSIFPNFAAIEDTSGLTEKAKLNLKECETRLFYVAMTRARKKLTFFYNDTNPSVYIKLLKDGKLNNINKELCENNDKNELDVMNVFTENSIASSPNNFISDEQAFDEEELELELEEEPDIEITEDEDDELELELDDSIVEGSNKNDVNDSDESIKVDDSYEEAKDYNNEERSEKENDIVNPNYNDFLTMTLNRL